MSRNALSAEEQAVFRALEEELWREESRFERNRMEELIAPDFVEFGGSGNIHDRRAMLAVNRAPIKAMLPLPDFNARRLAEDVVQPTSNSIVENNGVVQHRRRSSIWTRSAAGWVIRLHQGTPFAP